MILPVKWLTRKMFVINVYGIKNILVEQLHVREKNTVINYFEFV